MDYPFIKDKAFVAQPMKPAVIVPDWIKNKPIEAPVVPVNLNPINPTNLNPINPPINSTNPQPTKFQIPNEEEYKRLFGIELAKLPNDPFDAACKVFAETKIALWVSRNWLADPIVMAAKELYRQESKSGKELLSKEELADKVLELAEDTFLEGKDRISALKLYSEIAGYTGKVEIDASTKNILNKSEMKIIFVKAGNEQKETKPETKVIEHQENISPLKIKLVK